MKIDLSVFKQSFLEEASENIAALEQGLLRLESAPAHTEELNAVFRAAHSIKGAAGSLGFAQIAEFTHELETLLGLIRKNPIGITKAQTSLLLRSVDVLRELVRNVDSAEPMSHQARTVMNGLMQAATECSADAHAPDQPRQHHDVPVSANGFGHSGSREHQSRRVRITLTPQPEFFVTGLDPLLLFKDLGKLGELEGVVADLSRVPVLEEIDPERCYLAFTSILHTDATYDRIREVFVFAEDTCPVSITEDAVAPVERRKATVAPVAAEIHSAKSTTSTLRVATEKVDALIDLVGEIVIAQSMVRQLMHSLLASQGPALQNALQNLEHNTQDLQARVMAIRMVPVSTVFSRFPRIVRDLSGALGKVAAVEIEGGETELDKGVVERLADPLTHLVRNSIDHGLEGPEERIALGKAAEGTVRLTAQHAAGGILIEVGEDGRGLDTARIRARGEALGLIRGGDTATDEQVHSLIFEPGFSTAETVSDISGRGVGMDVVKRTIDSLNGTIAIVTQPGKGTIFRIKLPVTLAILDGLMLRVGQQVFIVPLLAVAESFRPTNKQYKRVVGQGEVVMVRGRALPLIRLHDAFGVPGAEVDATRALVVVVEADNGHVGLLVDGLLEQSQVVLKSLESHYQRVDGVLGATILGDGRVSLILDIPGLIRASARNSSNRKEDAA
jgi:two-component system chemotaxis sensor kinase CheA